MTQSPPFVCPKAYNLKNITDVRRLKQILNEAEARKHRIDQYMAAVRMRMYEVHKLDG